MIGCNGPQRRVYRFSDRPQPDGSGARLVTAHGLPRGRGGF